MLLHKSTGIPRSHFVGSTVERLQGFALHPQLHLRILLENLRVALTKQLSYPLRATEIAGIAHDFQNIPRAPYDEEFLTVVLAWLAKHSRA